MCEVSTLLLHPYILRIQAKREDKAPSPDARSGALSSLGAGCVESVMGEPWVEGARVLPCGSLRWRDGSRRLVIENALG